MQTTQEPVRLCVSVILPAYNEEAAVGPQINAIRRVLHSHGMTHEILVIDDGSQDRTVEEALQAGARVLRHAENRGYGAAIKTGITFAEHDKIVIIDADATYPADQIPHLVQVLETADMVVGARTGNEVHIPWLRRPAKWILGWLASRIAGHAIPDLNSGLRAFHRECAKQYFPILSNRFSFTTTLTLALLADDYRVVYHPIDYYRRVGKSKITPRHFMDFTILVLRMAMLFQPLKIFVPLAFGFGLLGTGKIIFDILSLFERTSTLGWSLFYQPVISTSSILLLLAALQLLLIGMMADGVIRRIAQHNRPQAVSHARWLIEPTSNAQEEKPEAPFNAAKRAL
ncbi:MAG: glycosyltransferase family 2 protein [Gammaproteobacteria bacterium]